MSPGPTPYHLLPTTDQGLGLCDHCGRAITEDWPAVQWQDGDTSPPVHFHACPHPSTDTTGATVCPIVGCINERGIACDARPRCGNLATTTKSEAPT